MAGAVSAASPPCASPCRSYTHSSCSPSTSRDVARMRTCGARSRIRLTTATGSASVAPARDSIDSRLSSTMSRCCPDSMSATSAARSPFGGRSRPIADASAAGSASADSAASSATQATPCANRPPICVASACARRVLPAPPRPCRVRKRQCGSASSRSSSASSSTRPTKLVDGTSDRGTGSAWGRGSATSRTGAAAAARPSAAS